MDTLANVNFTPQPTQPVTPPRLSVEQAAKPVKAELNNAKSVASNVAAEAVKDSPRQSDNTKSGSVEQVRQQGTAERIAEAYAKQLERSFEIDPGTETLIYRAVNADNGDVVRQVPEEVFLKIRAYNAQSASTAGYGLDPDAESPSVEALTSKEA